MIMLPEDYIREYSEHHAFFCPTRYSSTNLDFVYSSLLDQYVVVCKDCGSVLTDLTKLNNG